MENGWRSIDHPDLRKQKFQICGWNTPGRCSSANHCTAWVHTWPGNIFVSGKPLSRSSGCPTFSTKWVSIFYQGSRLWCFAGVPFYWSWHCKFLSKCVFDIVLQWCWIFHSSYFMGILRAGEHDDKLHFVSIGNKYYFLHKAYIVVATAVASMIGHEFPLNIQYSLNSPLTFFSMPSSTTAVVTTHSKYLTPLFFFCSHPCSTDSTLFGICVAVFGRRSGFVLI